MYTCKGYPLIHHHCHIMTMMRHQIYCIDKVFHVSVTVCCAVVQLPRSVTYYQWHSSLPLMLCLVHPKQRLTPLWNMAGNISGRDLGYCPKRRSLVFFEGKSVFGSAYCMLSICTHSHKVLFSLSLHSIT